MSEELRLFAEHDQGCVVEAIVGKKRVGNSFHLEVKWLGFEESENTWEPIESLYEDVPEMVTQFVQADGDPHLLRTLTAF